MPNELYHNPEKQIITVTLEDQARLGVLPTVKPRHPGTSPEILDNGTFPKTRPCAHKRARSRWRRKRRAS